MGKMGEWQVCAVCYKTKSVLWRNPWTGCQKCRLGGGNPESWLPGGRWCTRVKPSRGVLYPPGYCAKMLKIFPFWGPFCADVAIHDTSSSGENTFIADTWIHPFYSDVFGRSQSTHTRCNPMLTHGASLKVSASLLRIWHKLGAAPNSGDIFRSCKSYRVCIINFFFLPPAWLRASL